MQAIIGQRDLSGAHLTLPGQPLLTVQSYSHTAIGGPKAATISATSSDTLALWGLFATLRCPVEIRDDRNRAVWWGYVATVEVPYAGGIWRSSLDDMYNRLRVDFTHEYGADQGLADTTGWSTYSATVDPQGYGRKDVILTLPKGSAASAANQRAAELARLQNPQLEFRPGASSGARLLCRPWWDTIGWRMLEVDSLASAGYANVSGTATLKNWPISDPASMSFTVAAAANCRLLAFYMRRTGGAYDINGHVHPGGERAQLLTGSTRSTATLMESSALIKSVDMSEDFGWVYFYLASQQALATSTTYWVSVEKTGGGYETEYRVDEGLGYAGGALQIRPTGKPFGSRTPDADMPFLVLDEDDSATLIGEIATTMSEFVDSYTVENASGIDFSFNREADNSPLEDIADLVKSGTTNQRRVLADIQADRSCRVREEPAAGAADWQWLADGTLLDARGDPVDVTRCPVGMWVRLADPLARNPVDGGAWRFFVEEASCEATPQGWRWSPTPRGAVRPYDFSINRTLGFPVD